MKEQHTLIKGYRDLSQREIDLMNRIKAFGPELEKLCMDLQAYHDEQMQEAELYRDLGVEYKRLMHAAPYVWRIEGQTYLQKGLMFLIRSVAQPTSF